MSALPTTMRYADYAPSAGEVAMVDRAFERPGIPEPSLFPERRP